MLCANINFVLRTVNLVAAEFGEKYSLPFVVLCVIELLHPRSGCFSLKSSFLLVSLKKNTVTARISKSRRDCRLMCLCVLSGDYTTVIRLTMTISALSLKHKTEVK